jgi:hypothetical protein
MHAYITTNLSTTKIGFIRKYRPKRFHQIGSRSTAAPMSTFVMKINRPPFTTHALVVSTSKFFFHLLRTRIATTHCKEENSLKLSTPAGFEPTIRFEVDAMNTPPGSELWYDIVTISFFLPGTNEYWWIIDYPIFGGCGQCPLPSQLAERRVHAHGGLVTVGRVARWFLFEPKIPI